MRMPGCRLTRRLFCFGLLVAGMMAAQASSPKTTLVQDTIFHADGSPATGWMVISWPAFVTADGSAVAAGTTSVQLGTDGSFSVTLAPNAGGQPAGTYYTVNLKLDGGMASRETWVVPTTSPAKLAQVRATVVPSTMATQLLTTDWANANLVTLAGTQTISGAKGFAVSPTVPDPVNPTDAANKEYVDANAGGGPNAAKTNVANTFTQSQTVSTTTNAQAAAFNTLMNTQQSGLTFPSSLLLGLDYFSGGINCYPSGSGCAGTKTQPGIIFSMPLYRTRGEHKSFNVGPQCYGLGDCIGYFLSQHSWGGYGTSGDEGDMGLRTWNLQGDGNTADFPQGTVGSVSGSTVTGTWATENGQASNQWLGDDRPLINTSRGVYSTGTISSITGSGSPAVCTVTGTGTGWTALGTGATSSLFLNIPANNNGPMMLVWPILSITDDTHLVIEYNQNVFGPSCPSASMSTSGSYNIYQGAKVAALVAPAGQAPGLNLNATAVTLAIPATMFQAGDAIQQPVAYNLLQTGIKAVIGKTVGEPNGYGLNLSNQGPLNGYAAAQIGGNWTYEIYGPAPLNAFAALSTPSAGTISLFDLTADRTSNEVIFQNLENTAGQLRQDGFNRQGDYWFTGGNFFSGDGARRSLGGSTPQTNVADWVYISPANAPTFTGRWLNYYADPNNRVLLDRVDINSVPVWAVQSAGNGNANAVVNNGNALVFNAKNLASQTASISAATGVAQFAAVASGTNANSDMAGQIAIVAGTSGSYTFLLGWQTAPICTVTPTSDPTAAGAYWVSSSATTLTITTKNAATVTFNYICIGRT